MISPNRFCLQGIPHSFAAANCRFCSNSASILGKFRRLHETTDNLIKMRILFEDFVRSTHLKNFRREPISLLDGWIEIQNQNESDLKNKISTPEGRKNEEDYLQKTMYLSQVALTNAAYYLAHENLPDKLNKDSIIVTNASELRWMKSEDEKGNCLVSLPFTSANPGTNDP